jgi:hypothetical protein
MSYTAIRQVAKLYRATDSVQIEQDDEFLRASALVSGVKGECRVNVWVGPGGEMEVETQAVHPNEPEEYFPLSREPSVEVAVGRAVLGGIRVEDEEDVRPCLKLFTAEAI